MLVATIRSDGSFRITSYNVCYTKLLRQTPSNQILLGLALFLSLFVMAPVFERAYSDGVQPYMAEQVQGEEALQRAAKPFHEFMLAQTRETDLEMFARIAGKDAIESPEAVPFSLLLPAFATSELKTAFQIGS